MKEEKTFVKYDRVHPHFKWYLGLDALGSVLLVSFVLVPVTYGAGSVQHNLAMRSGAVAMSADQLTKLIKQENLTAYWLGPISGSKYSLVTTHTGKIIITYLSNGDGIANLHQSNMVIATVNDKANTSALITDNQELNNANDLVVTGNIFSYNKDNLDHMTVQFRAEKTRVMIFYPGPRSLLSLETDAEGLELIQ
jgi:hypothetical protein